MRGRIWWLVLVPSCAACLALAEPAITNSPGSILDQAADSPAFARELIAEYEHATNSFAGERLLAVGIAYLGEEKYEKARPIYERFLRDHPHHARALRGFGSLNGLQKRYEEAARYYRSAWALGDVHSLGGLGVACVNLDKYEELGKLLPHLLAHKQQDEDIPPSIMAYALSKSPVDEDVFVAGLVAIPDKDILLRDDTAHMLDIALNRLRTPGLTNTTFRTILQKIVRGYTADTNAWPKVRLVGVAEAYRFLRDATNAEIVYKQVLSEDPDNSQALVGFGDHEVALGHYANGVSYLRRAVMMGRNDALADLGTGCMLLGNYEAIKDLIPVFLEHKTEDWQILNTLLVYSLQDNHWDRALFYKAIDGLTDDTILRRADTMNLITRGLKAFGDGDRAQRLLKLKAGLKT